MLASPRFTQIVDWLRRTDSLLDAVAVAGSHAVDRQPERGVRVAVDLSGSPTGTVTVSGTVGGLPDSEVLTWSGSGVPKMTLREYTAITGVTTSLSGAGTIEVRAVGDTGERVYQNVTLKAGRRLSMWDASGRQWKVTDPGTMPIHDAEALVDREQVWRPATGDVVRVRRTGEHYEVVGVSEPSGVMGGGQQWHVRLARRQGLAG